MSIAQAADYLGVTPRTIRSYIAKGRLPAYRLNARLIRIDRDDLDALLKRIPTVRKGDPDQ